MASIIDIHHTLVDELEAATSQEQQLLHQEATIHAKIDDAVQTQQSAELHTSTEGEAAAFELHRLKETHAALKSQLEVIEDQNREMVEPEMKRLRREESSLKKETDETLSELSKETCRLQQLEDIAKASISERLEAEGRSKERRIELSKSNHEPKTIAKQIKGIEKESASLKRDTKQLEERVVNVQFKIDDATRQRKEVDASKRLLERDIETCTSENEEKAQEARSIEEKIDVLKAQYHSLTARRLETEIDLKKYNENLRHSTTVAALDKKSLAAEKGLFVKKRFASDKARNIVPHLQSICQDSQASLTTYEKQSLQNQIILDERKQRLHTQRLALVRHESVGSDMQNELLASVDRVEEKELQIEKERAKEKKLGKIIAVKQAQRNLSRKKTSQLTESIDAALEQTHLQKLTAHNLEKLCAETNKRCREFSTLHDAIKANQAACTETIQASEKATADLKTKVETLEINLDQVKQESAEKCALLSKECDSHESSVVCRANLRAEKNRIKSLLREKNQCLEQQEVQIKKLGSRVSMLQREVQRSRGQNEKFSAAQCLLVEQLNARDKELSRCSERSSLYQDTLGQTEATIKKRKDYIRVQSLQRADLRRAVEAAKRTLPDIRSYQDRGSRLEADIVIERKHIEELSLDMEDPSTCSIIHAGRARPLKGDDLQTDELVAKLDLLENRLHLSQNKLLEKEVALEAISSCYRDMEEQQAKQKEEVKPLVQDLATCRGRLGELSRTWISLMSELRMYQQSNIALSEEKATREQALESSKRACENGNPPSKEARRLRQSKHATNTEDCSTRSRPNAYVSVGEGNAIPFGGAHGPFQPSCVASGGMRHYRAPRVLTIEDMEQQANNA